MRGARLFLLAFACAVAATSATGAAAHTAATPRWKGLWATINICGKQLPDNTRALGIRGSIPGDGDHTRMYMRFTAQYYDRAKQAWIVLPQGGVSRWVYVGSGVYVRREGGWTFAVTAPDAGTTWILRGRVDYRWVKRGRIIRTARQITHGGHPNTVGADPKTYSASICQITG